ncbi:MAG: PKD domain-containing protein [Candidatus Peribacteraceae bacterium]
MLLACALLAGGAFSVSAQSDMAMEETVTVSPGAVVEFLGLNDNPATQFAWVLTKDRTFVLAGRASMFRFRPVESGMYRLDASAHAQESADMQRHIIYVLVSDSGSTIPQPVPGALVATDPPRIGETVSLPDNRQILTVIPENAGIARITLQTENSEVVDSAGTLFETNRTPLHVWFSNMASGRNVRFVATKNDGTEQPLVLHIEQRAQAVETVSSSASPETENPSLVEGGMRVTTLEDGSLQFSLADPESFAGIPVLTHWVFGDGSESLLAKPTHIFPKSGTYTVSVTLTNLQSGETILDIAADVSVEAYTAPSSAAASAASSVRPASSAAASTASAASSDAAAGGTRLGSLLRLLVSIVITLLVSTILGALLMWIIRFLRKGGGGLQKRFEDAESRLVKTPAKGATIDVAPPMQIRSEPAREESVASTPTTPEPAPLAAQEAPVPSWLQRGLKGEQEVPARTPAPETPTQPTEPSPEPASPQVTPEPEAPQWLTTTPPASTSPTPAPSTEPTQGQPPVAEQGPLPPWLQPQPPSPIPQPEPVAETPQTVSAPEPLPSPVPEPTPEQVNELQPEPEPAAVQPEPAPTPVTSKPAIPAQTPVPQSAPNSVPAPTTVATPASTPPATEDKAALEREERERERRRKKRQRYRENLKKRKTEASPASETPAQEATPAVTPTDMQQEPVKPAPAPETVPPAKLAKPTPEKAATPPGSNDDKVVFVVEAEGVGQPKKDDQDHESKK